MKRGPGPIVSVKVDREVAEQAHWQLADFPADFPRHVINEQAIDAGLILRERSRVRHGWRTALEVNVKRVAVAGVIIEGWRKLNVNVVRKRDARAHLPSKQEGIGIRNQLSPANSADLRGGGCAPAQR